MFDAEYFNKHVLEQIDELGSCSVEIHLHGGVCFRVRKLGTIASGYVLLEVFPQEGTTKASKTARQRPGDNEVFYDRVAIAYNSISYVLLTMKEPLKKERIGFGISE